MIAGQAGDSGRIQPYTGNPSYWSYKERPVLLLGGTSDDNLFQNTSPELDRELDRLREFGGNYARCTMSSRDPGNVYPFHRDEATGLFNLEQWNEEYWRRFDSFLRATRDRDTDLAMAHVRSTRMLTDAMDLFTCEPRNDLLDDRSSNEAYCLAEPGQQYAVYFPEGGNVEIDVSECQWAPADSLAGHRPQRLACSTNYRRRRHAGVAAPGLGTLGSAGSAASER